MQIPDEVRKCVAFLYCERESDKEARGTVFFDFYTLTEDGFGVVYAITARHVIDKIKERGIDGQSYFRLNNHGGGTSFISLPVSDWTYADDSRVDVAVAPVPFGFHTHDVRYIRTDMFLTDELIQKEGIGPGEDLFFPGLFVHHKGDSANVPIMRAGSIAAMPGERVLTINHGYVRAYLAEARSIGGLSGSPVFAHLGSVRRTPEGSIGWSFPTFYFLGLVQGHFDVEDILDSTDDMPLAVDRLRTREKIS